MLDRFVHSLSEWSLLQYIIGAQYCRRNVLIRILHKQIIDLIAYL